MIYFAETEFKNSTIRLGLSPEDRLRHVYVLGRAGMGKTNLLVAMALQDIERGRRVFFIDGRGVASREIVSRIPPSRRDEVVYCHPEQFHTLVDSYLPEKKMVLVDASRARLVPEQSRVSSSDVLQGLYQYALSLQETTPVAVSLYIDGLHTCASPEFVRLLSDARELGIAMTFAHEYVSQIPDFVFDAIAGIVGTTILFAVTYRDAVRFESLYSPRISRAQLLGLRRGEIASNLLIRGMNVPLLTARSIMPPASIQGGGLRIDEIQLSAEAPSTIPKVPEIEEEVLRSFLHVDE